MSRRITKANIIDRIVIIFIPIIISLIVVYISWHFKLDISKENGLELIEKMVDVWGILFGFTITAISILLSIGNNKFIELLMETNHLRSIFLSYIISSIYILISLIGALIVLILNIWNGTIQNMFIGANITVIISIAIAMYFLFLIGMQMSK